MLKRQAPLNLMNLEIHDVGIGLRACHYSHILEHSPATPWFEAISENYFCLGGKHHFYLEKIREQYPLVFHGVGLSLGGEPNPQHLSHLKDLKARYQPAWFSEHLCFTSYGTLESHDLLPIPYNEALLKRTAENILKSQDALGEALLIENISAYAAFCEDSMTEWDFIIALLEKADCYLLLDINNIYVSAFNLGFSAEKYLQAIPRHRVKQMHLGGFKDCGSHYLDNHGYPIHHDVWDLYKMALERFGNVPTLIEWDNEIPEFSRLEEEALKASQLMRSINDSKKIRA